MSLGLVGGFGWRAKACQAQERPLEGAREEKDAEQKVRKKINERIYKEMVEPKPKGTPSPSTGGYGNKERSDMNRLIEGNQ